jgi:hypothetical protein
MSLGFLLYVEALKPSVYIYAGSREALGTRMSLNLIELSEVLSSTLTSKCCNVLVFNNLAAMASINTPNHCRIAQYKR